MDEIPRTTSGPEFSRREATAIAALAVALAVLIGWYYRIHSRPKPVVHVPAPHGAASEPLRRGKLDINSAEWYQFALLPRIGEALGKRIVEFRDSHGPFKSVGDLTNVKGIGPGTLRAISPYVAVGTTTSSEAHAATAADPAVAGGGKNAAK